MTANISVKVPVPFDLVAAIKNDKAPMSRPLLDKAGAAVIDAVKALPLTTSPNSTALEFPSSISTKPMPTTTVPVWAPGRPKNAEGRVFSPSYNFVFDLRILLPNNTMSTVSVCGRTSTELVAKKVKGVNEGFIVLSNKDERIYDERWQDVHAAANKLTLDELLIAEDSIVQVSFASNFSLF